MPIRAMSLKTLYSKQYKTLELPAPWCDVFGVPETTGTWIVFGNEKNGKTWFTLMLSDVLAKLGKVLYISAEEGTAKTFQDNCRRAGLDVTQRNFQVIDKAPIHELIPYLKKRKAPRIVVFDNTTAYEEITPKVYRKLRDEFGDTHLMIFIAHYEKNEVVGATAKLVKKLAQVICYAEGLRTHVSGRCPGGFLDIDQTQSQIYHGTPLDCHPEPVEGQSNGEATNPKTKN